MVTGSLGERIAAYRRRRGLSQAVLAGLVGRSESWLSQVERGLRSIDKLSVLLDLSRVLNVGIDALLGRPWQYAPNGSPDVDELRPVRQHFTRYDDLLGKAPAALPSLTAVRTQAETAHATYQAARYREAITQLPTLLGSVDAVRRGQAGPQRRESLLAYVSAYVVTAKLLTKMGVTDLALLAADRSVSAALDAESLAARGMAGYQVVCALLHADRSDEAEHLAVGMAEQVQTLARSDDPTLVSVAGALWLIAAVIAARRTDRFEAAARLDHAEWLADILGEDANHLSFRTCGMRLAPPSLGLFHGAEGEGLELVDEFA